MKITLPSMVKREIDALIRGNHYASEKEILTEALRTLFETKPHLKIAAAVELFKEQEISLGKAAEIAGVSTIEFKDILPNRGIIREIGAQNSKELEKELQIVHELRK